MRFNESLITVLANLAASMVISAQDLGIENRFRTISRSMNGADWRWSLFGSIRP